MENNKNISHYKVKYDIIYLVVSCLSTISKYDFSFIKKAEAKLGRKMRLEWNLNDLFASNEDFYQEIKNVKATLDKLKDTCKDELNSVKLLTLLDEEWKIKKSINYILVYGSLMYYKNIDNDKCIALKKEAEEFNNNISSELKKADTVVLKYGQEKVFELCRTDDRFKTYKQYLNNLFRMQKHVQNEETNNKIKKNNDFINE